MKMKWFEVDWSSSALRKLENDQTAGHAAQDQSDPGEMSKGNT
jgi:hypothetical protein